MGFSSFVVLAGMRTGSNFLEANLNALPGVISHGELFNPHFIGKKDQTEWQGISLADRVADPVAFWTHVRGTEPGLPGFRLFHDHDDRMIDTVLSDPACAKIVLTRNPAETYVSRKLAQTTGQWKLTQARNRKSGQITFDAAEFHDHLAAAQAFQVMILKRLQHSGQTAFYIDYDDLQDLDVINGLAAFLGVEARLATLDTSLKKQNPGDLSGHVDNAAEMAAALAQVDRFNLTRTPNFEPRRAPMVPGFVAATGAGLIHLPVRGGPEGAVANWLARLGTGGTETDFSQKTLRQWRQGHAVSRTFTVVRHPVVRAYKAYGRLIGGELADLRQVMAKTHKIRLPDADRDADQHRAGFLAFLDFAGKCLSGQTGLRLPLTWASQTAIIQGFGQILPTDAILREDRLEHGLGFLCAEVGVAMPRYRPDEQDVPLPLADIYTPHIEKAASQAYRRDYVTFQFGAWR